MVVPEWNFVWPLNWPNALSAIKILLKWNASQEYRLVTGKRYLVEVALHLWQESFFVSVYILTSKASRYLYFQPTPCHYFIRMMDEKGLLLRCYTQVFFVHFPANQLFKHQIYLQRRSEDSSEVVDGQLPSGKYHSKAGIYYFWESLGK